MKRTAIYPGTFDPITNGHLYMIERSLKMFDAVTVAVALSPLKETLFSIDERVALIRGAVRDFDNIEVEAFDSLLVDFARLKGATAVIRGLRAVSDFEYELQMALMNKKLSNELDTIFMMPSLRYIFLSSSIVREAASYGGSVSGLVPEGVEKALKKKFKRKQ
jgi:pantetheine-phosphate adenylyltransferase